MPTCFQYLAIYEYRRASLWTRLIPDLPRRGKGVRWVRRRSEAGAKLYFLSSRHVLGVQDSRIPRVFKDSSPSFVCEAATKGGGREGGTRASPKGSNPSGSHARVLVPVYKMNTWKLDAAVLHTYKGVWPRVHTRAGETENRDQVGLLRSNMLPLSSTSFWPTLDGTKTHHPPPRVDTRVANTGGIYTSNPLSLERCPLSGRSNESLPWCFRSPYRCVVKRSTRGISRRWMNTILGVYFVLYGVSITVHRHFTLFSFSFCEIFWTMRFCFLINWIGHCFGEE